MKRERGVLIRAALAFAFAPTSLNGVSGRENRSKIKHSQAGVSLCGEKKWNKPNTNLLTLTHKKNLTSAVTISDNIRL